MKYVGEKDYEHGMQAKVGVLITNLGTPEAPTKKALRPYLKEFLSDPRVIETPKLIWQVILNGVILNTRPAKSAKSYKSVWTDSGSPLYDIAKKQQAQLAKALPNLVVGLAMRYGNPSIESQLIKMRDQGVRKILIFPMYPQYCAATTASTFDKVAQVLTKWRWIPEVRFINEYYQDELYVEALANSIKAFRKEHGTPDLTVFSYHGIPKAYLDKGDPYHCFCHATTRLVKEHLALTDSDVMTTFQSRFGPAQWLRPYTDEVLKELPGKGIKNIHIIAPAFSADCLETIEEIDQENREYFMESGGESYNYIPCLNDSEDHIKLFTKLIKQHTQGWDY
jgi:ferrochelatase|tara:strand:+ start:507 stop:1517 length:1011 start_codon:yes stop_codon:yes gene_type:complete